MFLGRETESERIAALIDATRDRHGGSMLVLGDAGIGKSALLRHAVERAEGVPTLWAEGVESESALAFAGLTSVLRPVFEHMERLPEPQAGALGSALALRTSRPVDRFAVALATLTLLAAAADEAPLLVILDDAHWLDAPSAEALMFAARRISHDAIAIIFAARRDERRALAAPGIPTLELDGLDGDTCTQLLRSSVDAATSSRTGTRLANASAGNPMVLLELGRSLSRAQLMQSEALPDPLPLTPSLEQIFGHRITNLPEPTRHALAVAAISESGELSEIAEALRTMDLSFDAIGSAEAAGICRVQSHRIVFSHPLLRSAAYQAVPAPWRRSAHRALAGALESAPARRAWHLAAGTLEPDEDVAGALEQAAADARVRGAPAAAAHALEAAAQRTPSSTGRVQRLLAAGLDFHRAGQPSDAARVLDEALGMTTDPIGRADLHRLRARVSTLNASPVATRKLLLVEADTVEPTDPIRAALMRLDAALLSLPAGDPPQVLHNGERAAAVLDQVGGPPAAYAAYAVAIGHLLCGQGRIGDPAALRAAESIDAEAAISQDVLEGAYVASGVAHFHLWHERHRDALHLSRALVARAREASAMSVLPLALAALSAAEFRCGSWREAYAAASESLTVAEQIGQPNEICNSLARLAHIEAARGMTEARAHAVRAIELAAPLDLGSIITLAGSTLGFLDLSLGQTQDAITQLRRTGTHSLNAGLRAPTVATWAADLAEAYVRAGQHEQAREALNSLEEQARSTGGHLATGSVARCQGLLASGDTFTASFEHALHAHRAFGDPFELARTHLCFGERLRRERRRTEARTHLRQAAETFDNLGAPLWLTRSNAELTATGLRARPRLGGADQQLTPQELQVAFLVAEGATNREAAAALFITPKTVEAHLGRVYRKLNVRSRTELARRLLASGASDDGSRYAAPSAPLAPH